MLDTSAGTSSSSDQTPESGEPYLFLALDGNEPTEPVSRHRLGQIDVVHIGRGVERVVQREIVDGKRCLYLRFPDPWMSSQHIRIQRTPKGVTITDPGSKNGSFVNGTRRDSAVLQDGDILQFGHTFFVYRESLLAEPDEKDDTIADMNAPFGLATILSPLARSFVAFAHAATSNLSLMLEGGIGTGKSILARSAHALSGSEGRFVILNVADMNDDSFEQKLRGPATPDAPQGALDQARLGTLVIENVDKLSLRTQTALSRIIASSPQECRLVSTSTSNLEEMVKVGKFDAQLAQQLSGFHLFLPPLRHRREDIGLLIANMIKRYAPVEKVVFSADAALALLCYGWPRNLSELESCVGTALAWRSSSLVDLSHLPPELRKPVGHKQASGDTIDTVELVQQDLEKRANMIAALRARSGHIFNNRDSLEQVRTQFKSWLARTDTSSGDAE